MVEVYGRLTVIRELPSPSRARKVDARCECGTIRAFRIGDLRSGKTKSCGCFRNQRMLEVFGTHGDSGSPEHAAWLGMIARCNDRNHASYPYYGGRGIIVYRPWIENFHHFLSDVGRKPFDNYVLDRRDNEAGYLPGNVRWVDRSTSSQNTRIAKVWTVDGTEYASVREAAAMVGVSDKAIRCWCNGWTDHRSGKSYPPRQNCKSELRYATNT